MPSRSENTRWPGNISNFRTKNLIRTIRPITPEQNITISIRSTMQAITVTGDCRRTSGTRYMLQKTQGLPTITTMYTGPRYRHKAVTGPALPRCPRPRSALRMFPGPIARPNQLKNIPLWDGTRSATALWIRCLTTSTIRLCQN